MTVWNVIRLSEIENFKDLSPEFYQKDFILKSKAIRILNFRKLNQISYITDGEHGSPNWSSNSGIKYITAENIKENYIDGWVFKQISIEQDKRNARSRLKENDILVYSVGAYAGLACVAEAHLFPANIPRSVAIIRLNNLDDFTPEFISIFLNSKFGKFQSLRFRAGNSQPVLALEKIKQFEIPIIKKEDQNKITSLYKMAYTLRLQSQALYKEAEELLEEELGLDQITFDEPISYTANFSEVVQNNRADAEFYQPKYKDIKNIIASNGYKILNFRDMVNRKYNNVKNLIKLKNKKITYIEIGDININDGYINLKEIDFGQIPTNAKISLEGGEIIVSMVRPYRGAISIVPKPDSEQMFICSGAFYVCTPKNLMYREIIWLYLRLVKELFTKYTTGTSYPTIDARYIDKLPIPLFSKKMALHVSKLIKTSIEYKKQSQQLLEEAKQRVEQLIEEEAAKKGINIKEAIQ